MAVLASGGCDAGRSPSILLIAIDTLRADRVGTGNRPGGSAAGSTPRIDQWATGAAIFRNATTPAPFTMPAMAATFTGVYPDRCGVAQHEPGTTLSPWRGQTLAEAAQRAGLVTAAIVANPWLVREGTGFERGFSTYARVYAPGKGTADISATAVTDEAIRVLSERSDERFFVWVHYFDPHMPYEPPQPFADAAGAEPQNRIMDDFRAKDRDLRHLYAGQGYSAGEIENARRLYDGEVRYVDHEVGRLLGELERLGRTRDTIVVVMSDHGEALGEHGLFFAHDYTVYDELVRVALAMRGPGIDASVRSENVSLIDVAPTLCRLASLGCSESFDGSDVFDSFPAGRTVFAAATTTRSRGTPYARLELPGFDGRSTMAVSGPLKLVRIPSKSAVAWEFYDRSADPLELTNLAPAAADRVQPRDERLEQQRQRLTGELEQWLRTMNAVRPAPTAHAHRGRRRESERTLRSLGYVQ
ncbi:MAG TPA: sulfatase [Candidatus Limnocylindrales bacterium]|nr:sulfatase [Candidatus Limnocylindrales bacterium]